MKGLFFAGVALGALTVGASAADPRGYNPVTAGPASQAVSGDLAVYGGFFYSHEDDSKGGSDSGTTIGGLARANIWLSPGLSAQIDLFGEHHSFGDGYGPEVVDVVGHLSWRNPGQLLGVFGSFGAASSQRVGTFGVEGQTYLGPLLLYGQGGFTTTLTDGSGLSAWYIHGEARYYINPNLVASANIGFAVGDPDSSSSDNITLIRWGLELETKFNGPLGGFVTYRGGHGSGNDYSVTAHAFMVGAKIHFNNNSLHSRDQAGATLKSFAPLTGVNNVGPGIGGFGGPI